MAPEMRPLRVLYLITDLGKGGAERFLIDLATQLHGHHDVDVMIGTLYEQNRFGSETQDLPIEQLHYQTFSLHRANSCPAYVELLDRFRPDVIHTHRFLAEFLSSYCVSSHVAYICHGHDNMVQLKRPSLRTLASLSALTNLVERRHLIRHKYSKVPTAFIANSSHTLEYYRQVLPRYMRNDVVHIPYGFNYSRFFKSEVEPPPDGERLRLINVGSFQDKKNQILLVHIARELLDRGIDFEITLLGDGATRAGVEVAAGAAGLDGHVRFPGNVDEVERWMRDSHIYVHTATYEPFGLVFLEAMAAGLPCVTLDGIGNRDLIEEGQNGFLLERQDVSIFADRIVHLARNREQYRAMSSYAQSFAKRYDISVATDRLVDFYRGRLELIRRARPCGPDRALGDLAEPENPAGTNASARRC